jgi:hypothetical protein
VRMHVFAWQAEKWSTLYVYSMQWSLPMYLESALAVWMKHWISSLFPVN